MRYMLVPLPVSDHVELTTALRWVRYRDHLADSFYGEFVDMALYDKWIMHEQHAPDEDDPWEEPREQLGSFLIAGKVQGRGRFLEHAHIDPTADAEHNLYALGLRFVEETEIPREAWTAKGIGWGTCKLKSKVGNWYEIVVSTDQLLESFPDERSKSLETVERRGKLFMLERASETNTGAKRRRGPKEKWDWALAHVALGILIDRFGVPDLQKSIEADLEQLFINSRDEARGESPSINMIRSYASALMQRRSELGHFVDAARAIAADRDRETKRNR